MNEGKYAVLFKTVKESSEILQNRLDETDKNKEGFNLICSNLDKYFKTLQEQNVKNTESLKKTFNKLKQSYFEPNFPQIRRLKTDLQKLMPSLKLLQEVSEADDRMIQSELEKLAPLDTDDLASLQYIDAISAISKIFRPYNSISFIQNETTNSIYTTASLITNYFKIRDCINRLVKLSSKPNENNEEEEDELEDSFRSVVLGIKKTKHASKESEEENEQFKKIQELEEENQKIKDELDEKNHQIEIFQELEQVYNKLKKENEKKTAKIAELKQIIDQSVISVSDAQEMKEKIKSFDMINAHSTKEIAKIQRKYNSQKEANAILKEQIEEQKERIRAYKKEVKKYKSSCESQNEQIQILSKENIALSLKSTENTTMQEDYQTILKESIQMKEELTKLRKENKEYKETNEKLTRDLRHKTSKLTKATDLYNALQEHHKKTSDKLHALEQVQQETTEDKGVKKLLLKVEKEKAKTASAVEIARRYQEQIKTNETYVASLLEDKRNLAQQVSQYNLLCDNLIKKLGKNDIPGAMGLLNNMFESRASMQN